MERELAQMIYTRIRAHVMDGLLQRNEFELPETMVKHEIAHIRRRAMDSSGATEEAQFPDAVFTEEARRRVKLGLIVGEIVRRQDIKLDNEKVQNALQALASKYEDPRRVIEYYRRSRAAMANIEAMVIENQVVDWVLRRCKITQEAMSFTELTRLASPES
jgi:trigger factor